jgi:hypothetical protein
MEVVDLVFKLGLQVTRYSSGADVPAWRFVDDVNP